MNKEILKRANELSKLIDEHEKALLCFEYDKNDWKRGLKPDFDNIEPDIASTNPMIIIEYDEHDECETYRNTIKLPIVLSDLFVNIIKEQIKETIINLSIEFDNL